MFLTVPLCKVSSSTRSPGTTFLESNICNPANRSDSVSFSASDMARPPTPKAVSTGVMEIPSVWKMTSMPIVIIIIRARLENMVVDGKASLLSAMISSKPTAMRESARVIDSTNRIIITVCIVPISSSPKDKRFTARYTPPSTNHSTVSDSIAFKTTSSPFQLVFSATFLRRLWIYVLNIHPTRAAPRTKPSAITGSL